jgi:hypothetical protein
VLNLTVQSTKTFHFTWSDVAGETEYRLLENADGSSGFTRVATIPANSTSHDHVVFLPARMNARYILDACNTSGTCAGSAEVAVGGAVTAGIGYVKTFNTGAGDEFGNTMAISDDGRTLAVAAYLEDGAGVLLGGNPADNSAADAGAVYVFVRNTQGQWTQQAYVKSPGLVTPLNGNWFGISVALSGDGNTLAVGAPLSDPLGENSGHAFVYGRNSAGVWSLQTPNTWVGGAGWQIGWAAALSGDGRTLAVGAINADGAAAGSGAVITFVRDAGGAWGPPTLVTPSIGDAGDQFGFPVALSEDGSTLSVGARFEDSSANEVNGNAGSNAAADSGAAYVFIRQGGGWSQQAYVKAFNSDSSDHFGLSLALSGDGSTLAVGAPDENSAATGVNGDEVDDSASNAGAAYVFTRQSGAWSQQAYVKASNTGAEDQFGFSVALSRDADLLAVGAVGEDGNATGLGGSQSNNSAAGAGAVYLFRRASAGGLSQPTYVKASNTGAGDAFAHSMALSGDGATLAVGARFEDGAAIGIGGDQTSNAATNSGAVYVY